MKVAIVHDWLTNLGGAERVVESLHEMFPDAPIYTSVYLPDKLPLLKDAKIITSFLQHWPLARKKHQLYPMLRTLAFESFDFSGYDLVISSSSAEAKGIITSIETHHLSYIHTPTRYYWSGYEDYLSSPGLGIFNPLANNVFYMKFVKKKFTKLNAASSYLTHQLSSQLYLLRLCTLYYIILVLLQLYFNRFLRYLQ